MLFRDLYRYQATPAKEARETWLTACLGELLLVDDALRTALLADVNLTTRGAVSVEHQRRFGPLGESQVADVLIESDAGQVILECKDGAEPDLEQLLGYRRLAPDAAIVLVAGEPAIKAHTAGKGWTAFHTLSWQTIYDRAAPTTGNPLHDWFRAAFRELLDWAGHAPVADVRPADVREMLDHEDTLEARQAELREAVTRLEPQDVVLDEEHWYEDGLSAWWSVERAVNGLDVRGLGLEAEPTPRGNLVWSLDLRTASAGPTERALRDHGFVDLEYEKWWRLHLFTGQARGRWEEELAHAVAQGRAALGSLGLRRGRTELDASGSTTVASVVAPSSASGRTRARITSSARALREALAERVDGTAGHRYATVYDGDAQSGWFWVDTDTPGLLALRLGWGKASNKVRFPTVQAWWSTVTEDFSGVALRQLPEWYSASFEVDLKEVPLRAAFDRLLSVGARLVEERRAELFTG